MSQVKQQSIKEIIDEQIGGSIVSSPYNSLNRDRLRADIAAIVNSTYLAVKKGAKWWFIGSITRPGPITDIDIVQQVPLAARTLETIRRLATKEPWIFTNLRCGKLPMKAPWEVDGPNSVRYHWEMARKEIDRWLTMEWIDAATHDAWTALLVPEPSLDTLIVLERDIHTRSRLRWSREDIDRGYKKYGNSKLKLADLLQDPTALITYHYAYPVKKGVILSIDMTFNQLQTPKRSDSRTLHIYKDLYHTVTKGEWYYALCELMRIFRKLDPDSAKKLEVDFSRFMPYKQLSLRFYSYKIWQGILSHSQLREFGRQLETDCSQLECPLKVVSDDDTVSSPEQLEMEFNKCFHALVKPFFMTWYRQLSRVSDLREKRMIPVL
jgi:hypothetical protein